MYKPTPLLEQGQPTPQLPRALFTVEEAAQILGIGRTQTFKLIKEGKLTKKKIGKRTLISHAAIAAFVEGLQSEQVCPFPTE